MSQLTNTHKASCMSHYATCVQGGTVERLAAALQPGLQDVCQWLSPGPQLQGAHSGLLWRVSEGRGRSSASGAHVFVEEEGRLLSTSHACAGELQFVVEAAAICLYFLAMRTYDACQWVYVCKVCWM